VKKIPAKKRGATRADAMLVDVRNIDVRLELLPLKADEILCTLEAAISDGASFTVAQVGLDPSDLLKLYLYANPRQMKRLIARLKTARLGTPAKKQRRSR
jgi:hypothetical protein